MKSLKACSGRQRVPLTSKLAGYNWILSASRCIALRGQGLELRSPISARPLGPYGSQTDPVLPKNGACFENSMGESILGMVADHIAFGPLGSVTFE